MILIFCLSMKKIISFVLVHFGIKAVFYSFVSIDTSYFNINLFSRITRCLSRSYALSFILSTILYNLHLFNYIKPLIPQSLSKYTQRYLICYSTNVPEI